MSLLRIGSIPDSEPNSLVREANRARTKCNPRQCSKSANIRPVLLCSHAQENVRFGSKADICSAQAHVRFGPKAEIACRRGARTLALPTNCEKAELYDPGQSTSGCW
jgi:hypothetical protein